MEDIQTKCSYLALTIIFKKAMTTVLQTCQPLSYLTMRHIRSHKLRKSKNRSVYA